MEGKEVVFKQLTPQQYTSVNVDKNGYLTAYQNNGERKYNYNLLGKEKS
jgi:hypothetical protein